MAEIEGVELVKSLPMITPNQMKMSSENNNEQQSIFGNLHAKNLLCSKKNKTPQSQSNQQWDAAITVLSRRLFCYRRPSSSSSSSSSNPMIPNINTDSTTITAYNGMMGREEYSPYNSLLTSLRLRPDGPLRHLSPIENMAIYDSAITYISRNKGREMVVFSERGGGGGRDTTTSTDTSSSSSSSSDVDSLMVDVTKQYVMGSAQCNTSTNKRQSSSSSSSVSSFEFSVHAQRGTVDTKNEGSSGPMLPPFKLSDGSEEEEEVTISPPRSRLLQFGKGDGSSSSSERKYGSVREMYTYTFDHNSESRPDIMVGNTDKKFNFFDRIKGQLGMNDKPESESSSQPECTVSYTRYGEAPPWYAPGRSCTLELHGKRIALPSSSNNELPSNAIPSVLSQHLPPLARWATMKSNFWSGWPSIFSSRNNSAEKSNDLVRQYYQLPPKSDEELIQQAVQMFRNDKQLLRIGSLEDYPIADRSPLISSAENALNRMQLCMKRLSKSFILSDL